MKADAIVDVEFLPTQGGGRKGPTPEKQFGCPLGLDGAFFDCRLDLSDVGPIHPGGRVRVPLAFLFPGLVLPRLRVGTRFELWEGKTIAHGTVVEFPEPDLEQRRSRRDQLRREFRPLYDRVLAILFEEDPIGINFEDNTDEYEPETDTIVIGLDRCRSAEDVQRLVHGEFVRWFDEKTAGPLDRYSLVAARIWSEISAIAPRGAV